MGILLKVKTATDNRKAVDFSLMKSVQNNAPRETFTISDSQFEELGLESQAIAFTDGEPFVGFVVLSENSENAKSLLSKRDSAETKSRSFSASGFAEVLSEKFGLKAIAEREVGYKANFKLTKLEADSAEYKAMFAEFPAEDQVTITSMVKIELVEETKFAPRVQKAKKVAADATVEPTAETSTETTEDAPTGEAKADDDLNFGDAE